MVSANLAGRLEPGGGVAGEGVPVGGVHARVALREVVERLALERAGGQAGVVAVEAVRRGGILLPQHLVEQGPLVVVDQVGAGRLVEVKQPGQLEHVVADAVLAGEVRQLGGHRVGQLEVLVVAHAADHVHVMAGHDVPEVARDVAVLGAAGLLPHPDAGDDLRRGHVALQPGQDVQPVGQRVEHLGVVEPLRGGQVPLLAGDRVQVGERLGQPAELGLQDHLHLLVREPAGAPVHPVGQLPRHVERLVVAGQLILVDHPGQVLVDHVVRRPDRSSLLQNVEVALGERRQVAGVEPGFPGASLERGELADQVAAADSARSRRWCWRRSAPGRTAGGRSCDRGSASPASPSRRAVRRLTARRSSGGRCGAYVRGRGRAGSWCSWPGSGGTGCRAAARFSAGARRRGPRCRRARSRRVRARRWLAPAGCSSGGSRRRRGPARRSAPRRRRRAR